MYKQSTVQSGNTRELELVLEVTRTFDREDPFGRLSGIAEIREAPSVRPDLISARTVSGHLGGILCKFALIFCVNLC